MALNDTQMSKESQEGAEVTGFNYYTILVEREGTLYQVERGKEGQMEVPIYTSATKAWSADQQHQQHLEACQKHNLGPC